MRPPPPREGNCSCVGSRKTHDSIAELPDNMAKWQYSFATIFSHVAQKVQNPLKEVSKLNKVFVYLETLITQVACGGHFEGKSTNTHLSSLPRRFRVHRSIKPYQMAIKVCIREKWKRRHVQVEFCSALNNSPNRRCVSKMWARLWIRGMKQQQQQQQRLQSRPASVQLIWEGKKVFVRLKTQSNGPGLNRRRPTENLFLARKSGITSLSQY
jgi:hypothetical protein